jgi:hypothetical protein
MNIPVSIAATVTIRGVGFSSIDLSPSAFLSGQPCRTTTWTTATQLVCAAPVLATRNARVTNVRRVGDGSHLKLTLEDDQGIAKTAIGFGLGDREVAVGHRVDLAFVPTVSTWQGRRSAELELHDLAISS